MSCSPERLTLANSTRRTSLVSRSQFISMEPKTHLFAFPVIGGFKNSRIILRKRLNGAVLADVYYPQVLSEHKKKKFVLELTLAGDIFLYSEDDPIKPTLVAFDPLPFTIDFLSVKNLMKETLNFYYGIPPAEDKEQVIAELLKIHYGSIVINPMYQNWKILEKKVTSKSKFETVALVLLESSN